MAKNQGFLKRLRYALNGLGSAYKSERSFRTQVWMGCLAILILAILQARPLWWAVFLILISAILALELLNTSLEAFMDLVYKDQHPQIGLAKDCAAGAVLILSFCSVIVFAVFLCDHFKLL